MGCGRIVIQKHLGIGGRKRESKISDKIDDHKTVIILQVNTMSWYKIDISVAQAATNETGKIKDEAESVWTAQGSPRKFALFLLRDGLNSSIYFSPLASKHCKSINERYDGTECDAPSQGKVSFILGHPEDSDITTLG